MKISWKTPLPVFEVYYFCAALLLTIFYTYPLVFNLSSSFYGFPWDSLGSIRYFWWLKFSYHQGLQANLHTYLAYPFGLDLSSGPALYLYNFTGFTLTYLTNEIVAHNIIKILNFPLLALTTYLLLCYLTRNRVVSAFIGLVCAFSPFHVIHSMAHFPNLYWVPLAILFLLKFLNAGGYKNGILFGFFWGLTFVDNLYYAYFIGLLIPVFIVVAFISDNDKRKNLLKTSFLKASLVSFIVFFFVGFPMMYPMIKGIFFGPGGQGMELSGLRRTFSDLFIFSAKPLDYLLPSKYNPFLGWLVPDLGMSALKGHRYTEHTLYLGYSLILLGGYAFYRAVRKLGRLGENKGERHTVYLFFVIAVVAAILSAPPFIPLGEYQVDLQTREVIAEHRLYLPQYFLHKLFPMFRVYARMGVVVLLAVCVLAAFGLREILAGISARKGRYAFLSLFSLVVFMEYAEFPPFRHTEVQEPQAYRWLAAQPGNFPIAEYPLGAGDDPYTTFEYSYYQRIHKKYLVNGAYKNTPADEFRKEAMDISKNETIDKLAGIGVKYVLIHEDKYMKGNETVSLDWVTKPPREKLFPVEYNNGKVPDLSRVRDRLRLVKDFGDTAVYEIISN